MNKSLSVERIFSLGDYQNIKFTDTVTEIPQEVALNPEAVRLIKYLQLVDIEWAYVNYMNLRKNSPRIVKPEDVEGALEFIEAERVRTFENLLSALKNEKE